MGGVGSERLLPAVPPLLRRAARGRHGAERGGERRAGAGREGEDAAAAAGRGEAAAAGRRAEDAAEVAAAGGGGGGGAGSHAVLRGGAMARTAAHRSVAAPGAAGSLPRLGPFFLPREAAEGRSGAAAASRCGTGVRGGRRGRFGAPRVRQGPPPPRPGAGRCASPSFVCRPGYRSFQLNPAVPGFRLQRKP